MKSKTNELVGKALDWAVAKCEGYKPVAVLNYSTCWEHGGPIIEREGISLKQDQPPGYPPYGWSAWCPARKSTYYGEGPTPLIAAMRCYVASKLSGWV